MPDFHGGVNNRMVGKLTKDNTDSDENGTDGKHTHIT